MDLTKQSDRDDDERPVLLLHGGSPPVREALLQQLHSMGNGFRVVEFAVDDPPPPAEEDGLDSCDVLVFLKEFTDRLLSVTKKDREVLYCILAGKTNKAIAIQLDLSERAIELRKASLMKKLRARSHTDLVRRITKFDTLVRHIAHQTPGTHLSPIRFPTTQTLKPASDPR